MVKLGCPIAIMAFSLVVALAIINIAPVAADVEKSRVVPSTSKPVDLKEPGEYTEVHVVNELTGDKVIDVHCMSKLEEAGTHKVPVGSEYQFMVVNSKMIETKPFDCHILNGDKEIVYKAYVEDAELLRRVHEDNIYWVAKDDGLYLRQFWKNTDVFWQPWP